ncbi:MAG: hypothetical protein GY749_26975 [Desulfobacteraceae bacterium]|nr:hypothetical protein [Desulfobacteraceae bacterium]
MKIYFEERIGNPELFTGRKKELAYFLNWADRINRKISMSSAILSRRKTGKTAFMQRLYNIIFQKNGNVIPFYYEIRETDQWLLDFSLEFFQTFAYQYIAFKTGKPEYFDYLQVADIEDTVSVAREEGFDYIAAQAKAVKRLVSEENAGLLWTIARKAPRMTAGHYNEYVVQMIDEFQFINRFIFRDKACTNRISNLAGSYLGTAEYKNAPLLVSGSWVGWLARDLLRMLPGRFQFHYFENMPDDETVEMILKYSLLESIPVSEEIVPLMAGITEGNPFYISSIFRSKYPEKDITTEEGLRKTLEFETLSGEGIIKGIWMEYAGYAMDEANGRNAKKIVLYLCKNRDREVARSELTEVLSLEMSDSDLEKKMKILVRSDIINQGRSNSHYRGVSDNIFDKVFRGVYENEIEAFDPKEITDEYKVLFEKLGTEHRQVMGEYSSFKGKFAEFLIINHLRHRAYKNQSVFCNMMRNLPKDFRFAEYETVWSWSASPADRRDIQIDIFARAGQDEYSLIGEVKNRKAKFSVKEAENFVKKAGELVKLEDVPKAVLFVFSVSGFFKNTLEYMKKNEIAWTDDRRWMDKMI